MQEKETVQQGSKPAKRQKIALERLLKMQDLVVGKVFEFRVLPLVGEKKVKVEVGV